jgi:RimJ/RimL family protein N-acetyltransferase
VADAADVAITIEPCQPVEVDARRVLEWRNDPVTQVMFFRPGSKSWPEFFREFADNYFRDTALPPVFAWRGDEAVAFVAFKRVPHPTGADGQCVDISINVAPSQRGAGIGAAVLRETATFLRGRDIVTLLAVIRANNPASVRAFENAGFQHLDTIVHTVPETHEACRVHRYVLDLA